MRLNHFAYACVIAVAATLAGCEKYAPEDVALDAETGQPKAAATAKAGDVLVIGGGVITSLTAGGTNFKATNTAELFSPSTLKFAVADAMTTSRGGIQAIPFKTGKLAHQVLVPGGASGTGSFSTADGTFTLNNTSEKTSEIFKSSKFVAGLAMKGKRTFYTATLLTSGKVLVAGGFDDLTPVKTTEIYDPATGKFAAGPRMLTARAMHTATLLGDEDGTVLVAGGISSANGTVTRVAEIYNPVTGTFTKTTDLLPAGMAGHTATLIEGCCPSTMMNGRVALVGGFSGTGSSGAPAPEMTGKAIVIYDPPTGFFQTIGNLNETRAFHTATMVKGAILFTGGVFGTTEFGNGDMTEFAGGGIRQSAEYYDPETGFITCVGGMTGGACKDVMKLPRGAHTATLFPSGPLKGKILLIGGNPSGNAELFDPAMGKFNAAGKLKTPRGFHAAVIVP